MSDKMTKERAAVIQSITAKKTGGKVPKGSFSSRATRAAEKNDGKR